MGSVVLPCVAANSFDNLKCSRSGITTVIASPGLLPQAAVERQVFVLDGAVWSTEKKQGPLAFSSSRLPPSGSKLNDASCAEIGTQIDGTTSLNGGKDKGVPHLHHSLKVLNQQHIFQSIYDDIRRSVGP